MMIGMERVRRTQQTWMGVRLTAVVGLALVSAAGCSGSSEPAASPVAPTAAAVATVGGAGGVSGTQESGRAVAGAALPDSSAPVVQTAAFPPRNEPFAFRQALEAEYRDRLRRAATTTYVDIEGSIVWTQEYLRYRLSGCAHLDAVRRVLDQIDGRGIAPECGSSQSFPPRDEAFDFRATHLEGKYRDGLRRAAVQSFVDIEGDIVWTQEYLRYRVQSCGHQDASQFVLNQVSGMPAAPACAPLTPAPSPSPNPTPTPVPPGTGGTTLPFDATVTISGNQTYTVPSGRYLITVTVQAGMLGFQMTAADGTYTGVYPFGSLTRTFEGPASVSIQSLGTVPLTITIKVTPL